MKINLGDLSLGNREGAPSPFGLVAERRTARRRFRSRMGARANVDHQRNVDLDTPGPEEMKELIASLSPAERKLFEGPELHHRG